MRNVRVQRRMPDTENKATWWKTVLYITIGVAPFPLAIVLLPMAEGLTGFGVLCVPFAVGGAATFRGYRTSRSPLARGVLLMLAACFMRCSYCWQVWCWSCRLCGNKWRLCTLTAHRTGTRVKQRASCNLRGRAPVCVDVMRHETLSYWGRNRP